MEVSPPLFTSWIELGVILVSLVSAWGVMMATLRSMAAQMRNDREWLESAVRTLTEGQASLQRDHERVMQTLAADRREHASEHRQLGEKLGILIGRCDRLIDRCDTIIAATRS